MGDLMEKALLALSGRACGTDTFYLIRRGLEISVARTAFGGWPAIERSADRHSRSSRRPRGRLSAGNLPGEVRAVALDLCRGLSGADDHAARGRGRLSRRQGRV